MVCRCADRMRVYAVTAFASTEDLEKRKVSSDQIASDYMLATAEGDPNTGIIVGDDAVMVTDAGYAGNGR